MGTDKDAPIDGADSNVLFKRLYEGKLKLAWLDDVAKGAPGGPGHGVVVRRRIHRRESTSAAGSVILIA